jgi:SAM-dependent methyltransferase
MTPREVTGREFAAIAEHARSAYLRYSFTKGTSQEVAFLADIAGLAPGHWVLDVGCGPGRHCRALAERGVEAVGFDLSLPFLGAAGAGRWVAGDVRDLPFAPRRFDVVLSACQGGFGLLGGSEEDGVLAGLARLARPGGRVVVTAFSAYFVLRHLDPGESFDAASGVSHERVRVKDPDGVDGEFDLWGTCFTPRELRLMAAAAGLTVEGLWSVAPGAWARRPPDLEHPELLLVGRV